MEMENPWRWRWNSLGNGFCYWIYWVYACQPWIHKPQTAVEFGGYHLSIGLWLLEEYPPNKPWFMNPGFTNYMWFASNVCFNTCWTKQIDLNCQRNRHVLEMGLSPNWQAWNSVGLSSYIIIYHHISPYIITYVMTYIMTYIITYIHLLWPKLRRFTKDLPKREANSWMHL